MIENNLWKDENEEFEALSILSNISRYNTRFRIKNESVAAHSFYVTWFVANICSSLGLGHDTTRLAMEAALVHDIPEVYINDITYDCKQLIPEISVVIEPYERCIIEKLSPEVANILFGPETDEQKLINAIVRYADVVSVKQYALSEMKLGNGSFGSILEGANKRLDQVGEELTEVLNRFLKGGIQ